MTFAELKAELAARGFDYLSDARLGFYINQAATELASEDIWPFRFHEFDGSGNYEDVPQGTVIQSVVNVDTRAPLTSIDMATLLDNGCDLAQAGTALYWYMHPVGVVDTLKMSVRAWPLGVNIKVYAYLPEVVMTAGVEEPLSPPTYHFLIVDIAVRKAYRDADNHEAAEALALQIDRDLLKMRLAILGTNLDGADGYIQTTEPW